MMLTEIQTLPTASHACGHGSATSLGRVGNFRAYACDECDYTWHVTIAVTVTLESRTFPYAHDVRVTRENGMVVKMEKVI